LLDRQIVVGSIALGLASFGFACASSSGLPAILEQPERNATQGRFGVPPDSVIMVVWEAIRTDEIGIRRFQRAAEDTTGMAFMESDWVYVPRVLPSAPLTGIPEPEKWVKFLFWAFPEEGGTRLYAEGVYNPSQLPTEPPNWNMIVVVPSAAPAWQYIDVTYEQINRRLGAGN
jgi:hypothetical protein